MTEDSPGTSSSRFPWRTVVLLGFMIALVVQGYLSFAVRPEPYPSIRMPSFGLASTSQGTYPVTFVSAEAQFEGGSTATVDPYAIMQPFRFSTARPSYDYMFGPARRGDLSPEVTQWLGQRVAEVNGGRPPVELRMCWMTADIHISDASLSNEQACKWTVVEF